MKGKSKLKGRYFATILIIIIFSISLNLNVFATDSNYILTVSNEGETKKLENDQGSVSKTITDIDEETGEVTVELKVSNTTSEETGSSTTVYDDTEIYLLVSENIANGEETFTEYITNIETLSSKIFEVDSNIKIGIVGMTGTVSDTTTDDDGNMITGSNDEGYVNGSADNAEIVVEPTNDLDTLIDGLKIMNSSNIVYRNNLQAAIRLANNSYSENTNKILISLYDGVPGIAIGVCGIVSTSGYDTPLEAVTAKHEKIASYTKSEILTLQTANVSFILLRPNDTSYDEKWYSVSTGELILDFDGSPYVQEIYGTVDNPTYGTMYTYDEDTLDTVITENIYTSTKEIIIANRITSTKIVDYFPEDLLDYFDFEYVGDPSKGTVSSKIDTETNTITWDIGTIAENGEATLSYKLTLKDMENEEILNKVIALNEKAVLTYTDSNDEEYTVTLENSPSVKLTENSSSGQNGNNITNGLNENGANGSSSTGNNNNNNNNSTSSSGKNDDTTASGTLPYTGVNFIIAALVITTVAIVGYSYKKMNYYKDIK